MFARAGVIMTAILLGAAPAPAADALDVTQATRLIRRAEPDVREARGWASDILDVLRIHGFPRTKENACAVIAIVDQESSFNANPAVPELGKLSEQALRKKLDRVPLLGQTVISFLDSTPSRDDSYLARIRRARTERDLDYVYRAMVTDAADRSSLGTIVNSGLLNRMIEEQNQISTIGSMQVSVKFAVEASKRRRWLPMALEDVYAVRDALYTRHGGLYYGTQQLLGYQTGYSQKIYRFADYNAGRYASRNAAVQQAISVLSGERLALDGDLLIYDSKGEARASVSSSERALRKSALGLSDADIRRDLLLAQEQRFVETTTYRKLTEAYRAKAGKAAPFAIIPDIDLKSPKIRRFMTTRIFAESVDRKYQGCMKGK
jgi:Protein of unknown function (DUF1615)